MNKKVKKVYAIMLIGILAIGTVGCDNGDKKDGYGIKEGMKYTYSNLGESVEVYVDKPRERAVTLSQFMTEMLLALGLEDKMVATALLDNPILPEYKEAYESIPVLKIGEGHNISKEAFMATGADFVSGWDASINEQTTGSPSELINMGIAPFMVSSYESDGTIEKVYEDFELLGDIFGVRDRADKVVSDMKTHVSNVIDKVNKVKGEEAVKVMVYDSGEASALTVGAGLANNLIELAGGENVFFEKGNKPYITVSFESIVAKNPEVIVVTDYLSGGSVESKINFLKSHPALKDVEAIKNNRIYSIPLADLSPGIRNANAIESLFKFFYKEEK